MLQIKQYVKAASLDEAYELNQKKSSVILGGMHWLKMGTRTVGTAIDLSGLGLDQIVETEEAFEIGCMVTLRQLEMHEGLNRYTAHAVRDAVKDIVGVQFRNTATVGGSVFGRYGFSDVLTVFLAMDTVVVCHKAGEIPLVQYAQQKKDRDILVKLIVKKTKMQISYLAQRHARTDFPVLTCCVSKIDGVWRASVGARPGRAVLIMDEQGLMAGGRQNGQEDLAETSGVDSVSCEAAQNFGVYVTEQLTFDSNMRGSAQYRRQIAPVLIRRAVMAANGEA